MAAAVPFMMAAGLAISAAGMIQQGNAAKAAADLNAATANRNAEISRQQGLAAVEQQERDARRRRGAAIASAGASGVTIDSFGDLLEDNARIEELDSLTILYNAELAAQSGEITSQRELLAGSTAQSASRVGAAGTLLSGSGDVINSFNTKPTTTDTTSTAKWYDSTGSK